MADHYRHLSIWSIWIKCAPRKQIRLTNTRELRSTEIRLKRPDIDCEQELCAEPYLICDLCATKWRCDDQRIIDSANELEQQIVEPLHVPEVVGEDRVRHSFFQMRSSSARAAESGQTLVLKFGQACTLANYARPRAFVSYAHTHYWVWANTARWAQFCTLEEPCCLCFGLGPSGPNSLSNRVDHKN